MRVNGLKVENFQIIQVIDITPEGDVVTIGGENEQGKTSLLNAIWVALAGRAVAPPMPIRKGEEKCLIRLDLGELIVTRTFTAQPDGKPFTDTVKVESADGARKFNKPQQVLDALMGEIGFDPFAFVQMKPDKQAETLLEMVPLSIDLEDLAERDEADRDHRRELNREITQLDGQIAGIPERDDLPAEAPDRAAIMAKLTGAAETNSAIDRERSRREREAEAIAGHKDSIAQRRTRIEQLEAELAELRSADEESTRALAEREAAFAALPALDEPVDTAQLSADLEAADATIAAMAKQRERAGLVAQRTEKQARSDGFTKALNDRETARRDALKKAKMPIDGLEFAVSDKGKASVMFRGVPFEQASKAEQIKASVAIAMAANPELRVLRVSDGSLLDQRSMGILREMAKDGDFQIFVEIVGTEGVGIVIENGTVKGAEPAEAKKKPAAKKPAAEGPLL